jgi:TonB family protein
VFFIGIPTDSMREKCKAVLNHKKSFLRKVKEGAIARPDLVSYVLAFDDGKDGCREDNRFTYAILDSYYSVPGRKLTDPAFLRRYLSNFPDNADPAQRRETIGLVWLFNDAGSYIPADWTEDEARAFVGLPEHWPIALGGFGKMRARDDLVFASVADPLSKHFDRKIALRLAELPSQSQTSRKVRVAALYADPAFGPVDLPLAERLLPISVLYSGNLNAPTQQARDTWTRIAKAYAASDDPALRHKGQQIRAKLAPPTDALWPAIEPPQDGRLWLSLANWPRSIKNPFDARKITANLLSANDYPTRALRNGQTGPVTLAARFGPDGKFAALEVFQSSGSTLLDTAAAQTIQRRLRPKLTEMTLEGYPGREVWVPLLMVDWKISDFIDEAPHPATSHYANGILTVIFPTIPSRDDPYNSCGYSLPSLFI